MTRIVLQLTYECNPNPPQQFWMTRTHLNILLGMLERDTSCTRKIESYYFHYDGHSLGFNNSKVNAGKYVFEENIEVIKFRIKALLAR